MEKEFLEYKIKVVNEKEVAIIADFLNPESPFFIEELKQNLDSKKEIGISCLLINHLNIEAAKIWASNIFISNKNTSKDLILNIGEFVDKEEFQKQQVKSAIVVKSQSKEKYLFSLQNHDDFTMEIPSETEFVMVLYVGYEIA